MSIVIFRHDIAILKKVQDSVNCCNLSATIVNSIHDVAKIKPCKIPAVEIRRSKLNSLLMNILPDKLKSILLG